MHTFAHHSHPADFCPTPVAIRLYNKLEARHASVNGRWSVACFSGVTQSGAMPSAFLSHLRRSTHTRVVLLYSSTDHQNAGQKPNPTSSHAAGCCLSTPVQTQETYTYSESRCTNLGIRPCVYADGPSAGRGVGYPNKPKRAGVKMSSWAV